MRIRTGMYLKFEVIVGKSPLNFWVPTGPVFMFQDVMKPNTHFIKKLKERVCK